jgi:hypothetical protein
MLEKLVADGGNTILRFVNVPSTLQRSSRLFARRILVGR